MLPEEVATHRRLGVELREAEEDEAEWVVETQIKESLHKVSLEYLRLLIH